MDKYQAEKIVKEYGGAIASDKNIFKKISNLPCSKAKIRYAFYVLIDAVIKEQGRIQEDVGQNLVAIYSMLDAFVLDEDADLLNRIPELLKDKQFDRGNPENEKQINNYFLLVPNALHNGNYFNEINKYIEECYETES